MNASPISVNAAVNDAAANTVTSPDTPGGAVVSGTVVVAAVVAGASPLEPASSSTTGRHDGQQRYGREQGAVCSAHASTLVNQ